MKNFFKDERTINTNTLRPQNEARSILEFESNTIDEILSSLGFEGVFVSHFLFFISFFYFPWFTFSFSGLNLLLSFLRKFKIISIGVYTYFTFSFLTLFKRKEKRKSNTKRKKKRKRIYKIYYNRSFIKIKKKKD